MKKKILLSMFAMFLCSIGIMSNSVQKTEANIREQNACTTITENVIYYNATLFDYNYNGFNSAARNMSYAQYNALSAEAKRSLDTSLSLTGPDSSDVRAVKYTGIGLVRNTLDSNGNVVNTKLNNNGVSFFPSSQAEVTRINNLGFGTAYDHAYFNVKFPFKKLSNGYTRFYSSENHLKYNASENKLELHQGTAGGTSSSERTQTVGMWPFNAECWPEGSTDFGSNVLHYGLKVVVPFYMTADGKTVNFDTKQREDMKFSFSGDDDVWIFIDDTLRLDIGGEHGEQAGWINFATNQSYTQITDATTSNVFGNKILSQGYHTLTIFYMERPGGSSNFKAEFNLPDIIEYSGTKTWEDNGNTIGVRPDTYTLKLYRNGEYLKSKTFSTNNWSFDDLPKYDDSGKLYTYSVQEDVINLSNGDRYEPTISGTKVKNTLVRVPRRITVKHIDKKTNEVLSEEVLTGYVNTNQDTSSKNITGYRCDTVPSQKTVTYTIADQVVEYYYLKQSDVVTKYVDENTGAEIPNVEKVTKTYDEGQTYTTDKKTIDGYTYTKDSENTTGTVERSNIEVTYYYKKNSQGVVTKHIDTVTKEEIAKSTTQTGLENDSYTTSSVTIAGYVLEVTPANATGKMTPEQITVTYEYRKLSDVVVKYVDENTGAEIPGVDEITTTYKQGESYTTDKKDILNYTYTKDTGNVSGTVERKNIEVIYYYKKNSQGVVTKHIDTVTKEEIAKSTTQTGLENDSYTTSPVTIAGYV